MRISVIIPGAVLVLTGALAGCSFSAGSSQLDVQKVEDAITGQLEQAVSGADVTVNCPSEVTIQSGGTFDCTASIQGGGDVTYKVTQTDDQGNVRYEAQQAVLSVTTLEQEITTGLTKQVQGNWAVTCDSEGTSGVIIEAPGATFQCEASDGSQLTPIDVTVKDVEGNITWKTAGS